MDENWLDVIPALPLERGVPVVVWHAHPEGRDTAVTLHAHAGSWVVHNGGTAYPVAESALRIDLSDAQGFGYALRLLPPDDRSMFDDVAQRWLNGGNITDADRLALARALKEVT